MKINVEHQVCKTDRFVVVGDGVSGECRFDAASVAPEGEVEVEFDVPGVVSWDRVTLLGGPPSRPLAAERGAAVLWGRWVSLEPDGVLTVALGAAGGIVMVEMESADEPPARDGWVVLQVGDLVAYPFTY